MKFSKYLIKYLIIKYLIIKYDIIIEVYNHEVLFLLINFSCKFF